jgi:hypothetical protein
MTAPATETAERVFVSWLRRGLGVHIGSGATTDGRASIRVTVDVERRLDAGDPEVRPVTVTLPMFGPDDVTGIDPRTVVRTWPQADVSDAEQNGVPLVEFSEPDLPWRYSPQGVADDRILPWMCLIVLAEGEFTLLPSGQDRPLAVVQVNDGVRLPNRADAWAWAHAEVRGVAAVSDAVVATLLRDAPERAVSRLLAPRKLLPRTRYTALVVPTAERHWVRQEGRPLSLPVYFHWSFGTGAEGDFPSLARRIQALRLPPEVGKRKVSVRDAAPRLHAMAGSVPVDEIDLEGALIPMGPRGDRPVELLDAEADAFPLGELITRAEGAARTTGTPVVAPPAYGGFFFAETDLSRRLGSMRGPWFDVLNLDVGSRAVAGVGTQVVQEHQQALMASAWAQAEGIRRLEESLNFTRVSRAAAGRLYHRDVRTMAVETLLFFSAPAHAQVKAGEGTVAAAFADSPIDTTVLQGAWRRLARPRGSLGRRQRRAGQHFPPLLERLNRGTLRAALPPPRPAVSTALDLYKVLQRTTPDRPEVDLRKGSVLGQIAAVANDGRPVPRTVEELVAALRAAPGEGMSAAQRQALIDLARALGDAPAAVAPRVPVDLPALADAMRRALDPAVTIGDAVRARLQLRDGRARQEGDDPLAPVMTWPEFPQPMGDPLRELSQDWLLPGLDKVPRNCAAVLETNPRFVEAYLVGLNHEMSRELLWRGFPTDRRGTYFRRFWRHVADVPGEAPADDIRPIHTWARGEPLGSHGASGVGSGHVVLLVRADLLLRYPTTVITALRNPEAVDEREVFPAFVGTLKPEVTFVGFPLTRDDLEAPGWHFAVQEQVNETRFSYAIAQAARTPDQSVYLPLSDRALGATAPATAAAVAVALVYVPTRLLVPVRHYLEVPAEVVDASGEAAR